jgi:hypothetical protein
MSKLRVKEIAHSNGTQALTVDANGFVATPVRSAFLVGLTSSITHTNSTVVNWSTTTGDGFDLNGDIDFTNNKFTAPVSGIYSMFATAAIATGEYSRRADILPVINGTTITAQYRARTNPDGSTTGGSSYLQVSGSWTLNLTKDDEVQINVNWETDGNFDSTETLFYHGTYWTGHFVG